MTVGPAGIAEARARECLAEMFPRGAWCALAAQMSEGDEPLYRMETTRRRHTAVMARAGCIVAVAPIPFPVTPGEFTWVSMSGTPAGEPDAWVDLRRQQIRWSRVGPGLAGIEGYEYVLQGEIVRRLGLLLVQPQLVVA